MPKRKAIIAMLAQLYGPAMQLRIVVRLRRRIIGVKLIDSFSLVTIYFMSSSGSPGTSNQISPTGSPPGTLAERRHRLVRPKASRLAWLRGRWRARPGSFALWR